MHPTRRPLATLLAVGLLAVGLLLGLGPAACSTPPEPTWNVSRFSTASLRAPHGSPQEGFFNPWADDPKSPWGVLRWWITPSPYGPADLSRIPRVANDGSSFATPEHSTSLTWVGHATFVVHDDEDVWLTDPHFSARALIPGRVFPPGVPLASIPPDAFAVLSHNHYDHLDAETVEALPPTVHWYVPRGMAQWFRDRERPHVTELDWWESARHGRFTLTCLPSQHWSRRIEMGTNESLWCAWLVATDETRIFFAGDTGYFHGFAHYGRRLGPIDVAMLPIGAYEPRWFMKYQHMDPAEAYQAFLDLDARFMAAMHWGTFDLTDEPIDLPPRVLRDVVAERDGDPEPVRVFAIGERWRVPDRNGPR